MEIDLEHVAYHKIIDRISLHIPAGQFIAIMGSTGSGKTTLGQMIAGLIQPDSGVVRVGPYPLHKRSARRRLWKTLGYVFQFPEHQVVEETVLQHMRSRDGASQHTTQTMEALGLPYSDFIHCSPFQISGGELRRITLAGALLSEPKLLILDEPTAGLDSCERSRALSYIKHVHNQRRMTVLYMTHRLEEALEHAERIVVLKDGRLYADFHPRNIRKKWPQLERIGFLKTPLLRFMDALEKQLAVQLPENIYKEHQLITFIKHFPKEGLDVQWLKLLSFGPSMSSRSFLHELDPRSKLMFVVTYVSLVTHSNELVSMVLYTSIGLLFVYAARLPLRYVWHGLKGLFPIMLLFICYQLLFGDVKHAFILPWKLMLFMITLIVFSATTTPTKLADGLESILKPLTFIRFPVQNFVMMISVAFRFIPILIGEAHAMLMAQKILNARYELGHFRLKVQSYVQFLVALFVAVLRRAYQLAFAMEARCYFPGNTTRSSHLSFR